MTSDNTMPRNKTFTTRKMVTVAMLSAIATVIYYLDFPVPLMPGFIKLDLSNVISLLAGFSMGPIAGVIVCLIKNVIQLIIKGLGTTMGIGNIFGMLPHEMHSSRFYGVELDSNTGRIAKKLYPNA